MSGRTTVKRPELPLSEEELIRLNDARAVVAELAERGPAPEELSELGYEMRMARGRALELTVQCCTNLPNGTQVLDVAQQFYEFIWKGRVSGAQV